MTERISDNREEACVINNRIVEVVYLLKNLVVEGFEIEAGRPSAWYTTIFLN